MTNEAEPPTAADRFFPSAPAFHTRAGVEPGRPIAAALQLEAGAPAPTSQYGYPHPGPQSPTAAEVMEDVFFVDSQGWRELQLGHDLDYIVVGSGCTGLAFTDQILRRDPKAKVLMLERGGYWLPEHFQNDPLPFKYTLGGRTETFPWTLSQATYESPPKFIHGSCPFFGGRSLYWSAWSPSPSPELLPDWPQPMIDVTLEPEFWPEAKRLLHVTPASQIHDELYNVLQQELFGRLDANYARYVPSADFVEDAPLAVGNELSEVVKFNKFSTPGELLALHERQSALAAGDLGSPLLVAAGCTVELLISDGDGGAAYIETSRGGLPVGEAKVVLASGCFPPTTLLMNSFTRETPLAGTRVTGHFISHIVARVPAGSFEHLSDGLELAALYLSGRKDASEQYHVQITGIRSPHPELEAIDAARECPDYAASATPQQLAGSEDYVVFVCATLGGIAVGSRSWFRHNGGLDLTTNCTLEVLLSEADYALWSFMEDATFQTIEAMADAGGGPAPIEYWHPEGTGMNGVWRPDRPPPDSLRTPGLVHEASTLWMGDPGSSVVGYDYRPHGVRNVYVTGSSLFPTSGSWNPTLTMCGFAQDMARELAME
jgi:GMC oxidoreductase